MLSFLLLVTAPSVLLMLVFSIRGYLRWGNSYIKDFYWDTKLDVFCFLYVWSFSLCPVLWVLLFLWNL